MNRFSNFSKIVELIRGIYATNQLIPLHEPRFIGNEKKYLTDCIDTNFVSSVGPYVDLFEKRTAAYTGSQKAVACINGTAALHLALLLSEVRAGDEVITQPLTFIATVNAIVYTGAHPVFIDVDRETLGLSPDKMKSFLERNAEVRDDGFCYNRKTQRRIKACVPTHTFGHPVRLDPLKKICEEYNLTLIEDAAESIGSFYHGRHTGTFGAIGVLSFNGNKTITTGGGGMILLQDEEMAKKARHLTTQAKIPHPFEFIHDAVGYNYRLPSINAALGVAQMEQLPFFIEKKRELAGLYRNFFGNIETEFIFEPEGAKSNYWLNSIVLRDLDERNAFLEYSNGKQVMTRPIWTLMNKLPMFSECQQDGLENAQWLESRIVNIPSSVIL